MCVGSIGSCWRPTPNPGKARDDDNDKKTKAHAINLLLRIPPARCSVAPLQRRLPRPFHVAVSSVSADDGVVLAFDRPPLQQRARSPDDDDHSSMPISSGGCLMNRPPMFKISRASSPACPNAASIRREEGPRRRDTARSLATRQIFKIVLLCSSQPASVFGWVGGFGWNIKPCSVC